MKRSLGVCLLMVIMSLVAVNDMQITAEGGTWQPIRWSADGSQLLVETYCTAGPDEQPGIYLLDVANGQISGGTRIADSHFSFASLSPSPPFEESTIIATEDDLYRVNIEDGSLLNLTTDVPSIRYWRWLPDSEMFIIQADTGEFYTLNIASDIVRHLTADVPIVESWNWLPDTEILIMRTDNDELYALNVSESELRHLTADVPSISYWDELPDTEILIMRTDNDELYALNIANYAVRHLTENIPPVTNWRWSTDDQLILFNTDDNELYTLNLANGDARHLTADIPAVDTFDWFDEDEALYIWTTNHALYTLDLTTGESRLVTDSSLANRRGSWRSGEIIWTWTDTDELYALNINNGKQTVLTAEIAPLYTWDWLIYGETLLIWATSGEVYEIDANTLEVQLRMANIARSTFAYRIDGGRILQSDYGELYAIRAGGEIHHLTAEVPAVSSMNLPIEDELDFITQDHELYVLNLITYETRHLTADVPAVRSYASLSLELPYLIINTEEGLFTVSRDGVVLGTINGSVNNYQLWISDNIFIGQQGSESNAPQPGWYDLGPMSVYILPRDASGRFPSPDERLIAYEDCAAEFGVHLVNLDDAPNSQD